MNKGVKFRIYPDKKQEEKINQIFGCCRLVYNKGLSFRNDSFLNDKKVYYTKTSAMLTEMKQSQEFSFLKDVDSIALQQSLRDLDRGFVNYFEKRASHPRFKSKHDNFQSYRTLNINNNIRIIGKYIKLPKLGLVRVKQSTEVGYINNATVEKTRTGKYFVVLNVKFDPKYIPNEGCMVGIDVGVKEFYTDSNGNYVHNPRYYEVSEQKLAKAQHKLSRKQRHSKNYEKQRKKVAKIHEKIVNQRNDFLQKESTKLIRENQTICVEDLNIKGLMRNHNIAKSIVSVSWSKFYKMLEYKALWYGREIIKIPTFYPSSQTCSCCGYKNPLVRNLNMRTWECPKCHSKHDRDRNAAVNILNKGLLMATG